MIITESHCDDAFLSLGGLIERWTRAGKDVTILTVYSGTRKRAEDAKAFADAVGAKWIGLGFVEKGNAKLRGPAPFELTMEQRNWLRKQDPLLIPLGVGGHPEHLRVRDTFYPTCPRILYYVDQPYGSKLKNQEELQKLSMGKKIVALYKPSSNKWRHCKLFRDQQKFFWYNPIEQLNKTFELVLE